MKRNSLVKHTSTNNICFILLMVFVWSDSILMRYVRVFLMKLPIIWPHTDMILSFLYVSVFLLAITVAYKELYVKDLAILLFFYGVFYLHDFLYPYNDLYYNKLGGIVTKDVFPMFLVGICVYRIDRQKVLKVLNTISLITVIFYSLYKMMFHAVDAATLKVGDMNSAYAILPHLCIVFAAMMRKTTPWNIGSFALGALLLLFLGNRGSLLCLGTFVIFVILFSGRLKRPVLFLVVSIVIMLALFAFGLLDFLYEMADELGFSLRIFKKIQSGEITYTSGRDKISRRVWEYIKMYPLMGLGIFSDRRVAGGNYAHNIVLEILINYGVVIGLLFLGLILYIFTVAFVYMRNNKDYISLDFFTSVFFAYCFKLILSNSYLLEPYFFFTIGFAYAAFKEQGGLSIPRLYRVPVKKSLEGRKNYGK